MKTKTLYTITVTSYSRYYGAHVESTRSIIRSGKRLTMRGIERMMRHGCAEHDADPALTVTMVSTAQYC